MKKIALMACVAAVAASAVPAWAETYYSQVVNNQGQSSFASPGVAGAWNTEPDGNRFSIGTWHVDRFEFRPSVRKAE